MDLSTVLTTLDQFFTYPLFTVNQTPITLSSLVFFVVIMGNLGIVNALLKQVRCLLWPFYENRIFTPRSHVPSVRIFATTIEQSFPKFLSATIPTHRHSRRS